MAGQPLGLNPGANQYTGPAYSTKKRFIVAAVTGDITTTVNKGRQAGLMCFLLLLDVYGSNTCYANIKKNSWSVAMGYDIRS